MKMRMRDGVDHARHHRRQAGEAEDDGLTATPSGGDQERDPGADDGAAIVVATAITANRRRRQEHACPASTLAYQSSVQFSIGKATKFASLKLIADISVSGRKR